MRRPNGIGVKTRLARRLIAKGARAGHGTLRRIACTKKKVIRMVG